MNILLTQEIFSLTSRQKYFSKLLHYILCIMHNILFQTVEIEIVLLVGIEIVPNNVSIQNISTIARLVSKKEKVEL